MLMLMTRLLEKEGHEVLSAEDGLSAIDLLKEHIPDLIFVDLVMPNIGGEKLCRIIRSMPGLSHVHIVVLSAIAAEEKVDFEKFGANGCIAKGPYDKMSRHVLSCLEQLDKHGSGGLPREILGVEDIHEREITKELLHTKKHSEAILRNMSEGILEVTLDGKIIYANAKAIALSGISEEALLASDFAGLFHNADQNRIADLMARVEDAPVATTEDRPLRLIDREVLLNVIPLKNECYKSNIVIINDISKRKRAEREKRRLEAKLQQAQKLEAVATLAGGIAHDFNNLLMAIQGNVSLMLLDIDSPHPFYAPLMNVSNQVKGGAELTAQLLGYARKGKYYVKPIDLNKLLLDTSEAFGRTRKEVVIRRDLAADLLAVEADPGQIQQVLLNLFINAADAMPDGGDLVLVTSNVTHKDMKHRAYDPKRGNYVRLTVTDTGKGMSKEIKERVFDPFFTTKEMGRGTGLGLASTYGIVKGHSGYIDVESDEGRGTTFTIYLPATDNPVEATTGPRPNIVKGSGTILLVDDEDRVLQVGVQLLTRLGYTVIGAKGGREALDIYEQNKEAVDLVILDMIMPQMGGGETYDKMKQIDPGVKVLLSSGYSIDSQAKEILNRGCNAFIQKPFGVEELSGKICEVMGSAADSHC